MKNTAAHIACLMLLAMGDAIAERPDANALRVSALADRYIGEVRLNFPVRYAASGLPDPKRDSLDINSPKELGAWRAFLNEIGSDSQSIERHAKLARYADPSLLRG